LRPKGALPATFWQTRKAIRQRLAPHLGAFFTVLEFTGAQPKFLLKDLGKITPARKPDGVDDFGDVHFGGGNVVSGQFQTGMPNIFGHRFVVEQFKAFL
tara:strand:- start:64 stop:360 length:297 start_codon:yes stop_codon:yes gene_type:complete